MDRELSSLPLDKFILNQLDKAGFSVVGDVVDFKAFELSKELDISHDEALSLLNHLKEKILNKTNKYINSLNVASGAELLKKEKQHIITFSSCVDELLDGGVVLGKITEICGPPGIGKTQFCMQLAVDVQLPRTCGGLESEALYIDTEGSFVVDRVVDIARATVLHCHSIIQNTDQQMPEDEASLKNFHVHGILSRIHYFRCFNYTQLIALLHTLETFLQQHPQVRLVLVDSVAYVFRQEIDDFALRNRHLSFLSQTFSTLCLKHNLAVVLVNHMTMKAHDNRGFRMVPALGEAWGHNCTYRIILHWGSPDDDADAAGNKDNKTKTCTQGQQSKDCCLGLASATVRRRALLYKSPSKKDDYAFYQITTAGIRDRLASASNG